MYIKIIAVQKHKDEYIKEGIKEYEKRLGSFCTLEWQIIKEENAGEDRERAMREEGRRILQAIPSGYAVVVLDVQGTHMTSEEFSAFLEEKRDLEGGKIAFIIGGPFGNSPEVLEIADKKLSVSKFTLTHQMIRLILLEQLYRGFSILAGSDYHK